MDKDQLKEILEAPTHHSYLLVGNKDSDYETLRLLLREKVQSGKIESADVWSRTFETISIDDARQIKETQTTRPIGERRVMLLSLSAIQNEAQNSLLKLFEEPSSSTVFFVCANDTAIFLPTVLSRFYIIDSRVGEREEKIDDAGQLVKKFLTSGIKDRFDLLESIIKEKDKVEAEKFLNSLEKTLHETFKNSKAENQSGLVSVFEDIFAARRFLRSRSPSVKMILEHLCAVVPLLGAGSTVSKKS